jgi:hypothetical protein
VLFINVFLLALIHPYESLVLTGSYTGYSAMAFLLKSDHHHKRRLLLLTVLLAAMLPGTGYSLWVAQQPVWQNFAQLSLFIPRARLFWVVGYGLAFPAAMYGAWLCFKRPEYQAARLLVCWFGGLMVLLMVIKIPQSRVACCGHFPMCILAGLGVVTAMERLERWNRRWARGAAGAFLLVSSSTSVYLLCVVYPIYVHRFDSALVHLAPYLRSAPNAPPPVVLCDEKVAYILPGLTGVTVYAGAWSLTPGWKTRERELIRAGIFPPSARDLRLMNVYPANAPDLKTVQPIFVSGFRSRRKTSS